MLDNLLFMLFSQSVVIVSWSSDNCEMIQMYFFWGGGGWESETEKNYICIS